MHDIYHRSSVPRERNWYQWIKNNMNNSALHPLEGEFSLKLVYEWSAWRITLVILGPPLVSLLVGILYSRYSGDVVAAWTVALYIVTCTLGELLQLIGKCRIANVHVVESHWGTIYDYYGFKTLETGE